MRILKFGGTSLLGRRRMARMCDIVAGAVAESRIVVVVSALGGVTDALEASLRAARHGRPTADRVESLRKLHLGIVRHTSRDDAQARTVHEVEARLEELADLLHGVALLGECPPSTRDRVLALGEQLAAVVVASALKGAGLYAEPVDASELVVTDSEFGAAEVDLASTFDRIRHRLETGPETTVPVVTGFLGADAQQRVTTLGRGGSDYTAALFGAALRAERVQIWTDVDGILSAEPRKIRDTRHYRSVSYEEASELAWFGGRVLHPRTLEPLAPLGIPVEIRNTLRPAQPGTMIETDRPGSPGIRAVSGDGRYLLVRAQARDVPDLATVLCAAAKDLGAAVHVLTLTRPGRCLALIDRRAAPPGFADQLRNHLHRALGPERLNLSGVSEVGLVALVGKRVGDDLSSSERLTAALNRSGTTTLAICGGDSTGSVMAAVEPAHIDRALTALHRALVLERPRVSLLLAGHTGRVGRALLEQLRRRRHDLNEELGAELALVGVFNSRGGAWDPEGLPWDADPAPLRAAASLEQLPRNLDAGPVDHPVFVDCTAGPEAPGLYESLIDRGVAVVTANKVAGSGPSEAYRRILAKSRSANLPFGCETTVASALPVLATIDGLCTAGLGVCRVTAVLSGSLSFIFSRMREGERFSRAVRQARESGLTEPHPRDDLSGEDVARKLVILLRHCGLSTERADIRVEELLPAEVADLDDPTVFLDALPALDAAWERRMVQAATRGRVIVPVARYETGRAAVELMGEAPGGPLTRLSPGDNAVVIETEQERGAPITILGPGAGPDFTARGLLADVTASVRRQLGPRHRERAHPSPAHHQEEPCRIHPGA